MDSFEHAFELGSSKPVKKKLPLAEQSLVIAGVQKNQVSYFLSNIEKIGYM